MWYTLPNNTKHFPLTIERVKEIKNLNKQGIVVDELEAVEVTSGKPKEVEPDFVDVVGQISLRSLEKNDRRRRDQQRGDQGRPGPRDNRGLNNNERRPFNNDRTSGPRPQSGPAGQSAQGPRPPMNPNRPMNRPSNRPSNPNEARNNNPNNRPNNPNQGPAGPSAAPSNGPINNNPTEG